MRACSAFAREARCCNLWIAGKPARCLPVSARRRSPISREASHSTVRNRIPGTVRAISPEGPLASVELDCGFLLVALVTAQSVADLNLRLGDEVTAIVKTTSVHLVPAQR
jgi:molybdopterin-binding protein